MSFLSPFSSSHQLLVPLIPCLSHVLCSPTLALPFLLPEYPSLPSLTAFDLGELLQSYTVQSFIILTGAGESESIKNRFLTDTLIPSCNPSVLASRVGGLVLQASLGHIAKLRNK